MTIEIDGYKLDLSKDNDLRVALAYLLDKNPDRIEMLTSFVTQNLNYFRKSIQEKLNWTQQALLDSVSCSKINYDEPNYIASLRASWENAFRGMKLSQFSSAVQGYYLKLCDIAPVPMQYGQKVEVGITNDLTK